MGAFVPVLEPVSWGCQSVVSPPDFLVLHDWNDGKSFCITFKLTSVWSEGERKDKDFLDALSFRGEWKKKTKKPEPLSLYLHRQSWQDLREWGSLCWALAASPSGKYSCPLHFWGSFISIPFLTHLLFLWSTWERKNCTAKVPAK